MLNAMVYSAVIVVQMVKIAENGYWEYLPKTSKARQWSKEFYFF